MTAYFDISYSSLSTEQSCSRRFELRKLYPQRRSRIAGFAADVGTALHAGYQDWLVSKDYDKALWQMMLKYPFDLMSMQTDDYRDINAAVATLEAMIDSPVFNDYELALIERPDGATVPAIEVPFAIELVGLKLPDGRQIRYTGFIDAIMRHTYTGYFRSMDIKTHRSNLRDATAKYKFDGQQTPYGIVVDHIAQQGVQEFEILYLDVYVDLLNPRVTPYEFTRQREDLEEWLLDISLRVKRIIEYSQLNHFPRTLSGCLTYNTPCQYLEICSLRDREAINGWLLMGEEPVEIEPFVPWITAEIDVFGKE